MEKTGKRKTGTPRKVIWPRVREYLKKAVPHLLVAVAAALCGYAELAFSVRPFGVALLAAADVTFLPAACLGVSLSAFLLRDAAMTASLAVCLAVRGLFWFAEEKSARAPLFCEKPVFRVLSAAVAAVSLGVYVAVRGGYVYYDLFGVLLSALTAPLAAFLYIGVFGEDDALFPYSREAGYFALLLSAIYALRGVSFAGIFPAALLAADVTLLLTSHKDTVWGSVGGALAALPYRPELAPAFFLLGLLFGAVRKTSRGGGILLGSAAAVGYAYFRAGSAGVTELLPALLSAGALYLAFESAGLSDGAATRRAVAVHRRAGALSAGAGERDAARERLKKTSESLQGLSKTFYQLCNRTRRPSLPDLRRLADKTFDKFCPSCPSRDVCWEERYGETAAVLDGIAGRLSAHGVVSGSHLPPEFLARCERSPALVSALNEGVHRLTEETLRFDKTAVVAMDYAAFGHLISETLREAEEDFSCDVAAGERIRARLSRLGYSLESAAVCGKTHRRVFLRGVRSPFERLRVREIARVIAPYCKFPLGEGQAEAKEGVYDVVFPERPRVFAGTVKLTRPRAGGEGRFCGDSVTVATAPDGTAYALLCDGMGSGNLAALTSTLAVTFLRDLLSAGVGASLCLKMLNGFLAARGQHETEASTTVDLLSVDTVTGEGTLYKCGAAPSFLLREGEVTRFFSRTAPAGILETLDAERIRFDLRAGDVLLQVSDGVSGGEDDCKWLSELLRTGWTGDAAAFARLVLNRASSLSSNDDLSVLVTEISPAEPEKAEKSA